jgi:hypothetical protein
MKNFLKAIILGTTLGLTSCVPSPYKYNGKIGNESVSTLDNGVQTFRLYVTKEDGRIITYLDSNKDKKLDSVTITKNKESQTFEENDIIGAEAFKLAQQQYTNYLAKILEIKKKKALEDIQ